MEEALKKATDEAHKQRVALTGEPDQAAGNLSQASQGVASRALQELEQKQEA